MKITGVGARLLFRAMVKAPQDLLETVLDSAGGIWTGVLHGTITLCIFCLPLL